MHCEIPGFLNGGAPENITGIIGRDRNLDCRLGKDPDQCKVS